MYNPRFKCMGGGGGDGELKIDSFCFTVLAASGRDKTAAQPAR